MLDMCRDLARDLHGAGIPTGDELTQTAEQLYVGILDRDSDSGGLEGTKDAVAEGQIGRRAAEMLDSAEFRYRFLK